jgi:hypothetical protein
MPSRQTSPLVEKSLTVLPLIDERPKKNEDAVLLHMIPLVPYGWMEYNQPEAAHRTLHSGMFYYMRWGYGGWLSASIAPWQFKPTEEVAQALAAEISNYSLFKEASFSPFERGGDMVLRGAILSTKYESKVTGYGLGPVGNILWMFGLPVGTIKNDISLKLKLEDRMTRQVLWERTYSTSHDEGWFWMYSIPSDFWYDSMLKELMPSILGDLEQALRGGLATQ